MARTDQPHKLSFDAFVAAVTDLSNPLNEKHRDLDYSRPATRAAWNGSKSKIPIWCTVHEEFFTQLAANHRSLGQGCPKCGKQTYKDKRKNQDPVAQFRAKHGDLYDYSRVDYTNNHTPVEIVCTLHGPFMQKPLRHASGDGCPKCWQRRKLAFAKDRTAEYKTTYAVRAAKVHDGKYAVLSLPEHSHDDAKFLCPKHGEFTQKAHVHLLGHGCPICGKTVSQAQRDVAAFIEELGCTVEHENSTVLGGLHIDVWVPEKNIGLEYHGSYWRTEARVGKKHREKWERADAAGVRLIQLFDFEWLERQGAVRNRLKALFGRDTTVGARTCELRSIDRRTAAAFFTVNHTQGAAPREVAAYGLYADGVLVAAASFGHARFGKADWEVLRYASVGRVSGGFARLWSAFRAAYGPKSVVSYCDLRWGDGKMYEANGFVLDGITPPDYWYTQRENHISRFAAQKRPEGQTEKEWAAEHGYSKVLGVGHQRWLWMPPKNT